VGPNTNKESLSERMREEARGEKREGSRKEGEEGERGEEGE
jgi:hypothetical protein